MRGLQSILFVCFGVSLMTSGCATIVSRANYPVTIKTEPPGAEVRITNWEGELVHVGRSPTEVVLRASRTVFAPARYTIEVRADGETVARRSLSGSLDPWYLGNFAFGGLLGLLFVDPGTGAMWRLPSEVAIPLPSRPASMPRHRETWAQPVTRTKDSVRTSVTNRPAGSGDALDELFGPLP